MSPMTPRNYQWSAIDTTYDFLMGSAGNPVVVMPTGTGKSIVIGGLTRAVLERHPGFRVMMLTHVKELINQNADKIMKLWPQAPIGIHSAGLKRRDLFQQIIYGGVKTVANSLDKLGRFDLLLIDECHLLSPNAETTYWTVINYLLAINPHMRIVGFTATNYRRGQGKLTDGEGRLFTHTAVDMSTQDWWDWFIANGFLVPPIPKKTDTTFNMAAVGITNGDYNLTEMNSTVDKMDTNHKVARELLTAAADRRKILTFCAGVDHAVHMAEIMTAMGRKTMAVYDRMPDRDKVIAAYLAGEFDSITNNNILTTGFDDPAIDCIGMARPTVSTSLWVQMLGRGTRPFEAKQNCLVLDFAGNCARLGPVNDPVIPRPKGKGGGEAPVKLCEACGCYNHASVRVCSYCGTAFDIQLKIKALPTQDELYRGSLPEYKWYDVNGVFYHRHLRKADGHEMIRVSYHVGSRQYSSYFDFEAVKGLPRHMAHDFWRRKVGDDIPQDNAAALAYLWRYSEKIHEPTRIKVHVNKTMPEIVAYEY